MIAYLQTDSIIYVLGHVRSGSIDEMMTHARQLASTKAATNMMTNWATIGLAKSVDDVPDVELRQMVVGKNWRGLKEYYAERRQKKG